MKLSRFGNVSPIPSSCLAREYETDRRLQVAGSEFTGVSESYSLVLFVFNTDRNTQRSTSIPSSRTTRQNYPSTSKTPGTETSHFRILSSSFDHTCAYIYPSIYVSNLERILSSIEGHGCNTISRFQYRLVSLTSFPLRDAVRSRL